MFRCQAVTFAGRRHLHVLDQSGNIMNQHAGGAVPFHNVVGVPLSALQRGLAIIEPELALGFLRTVTPKTGGFKDRLDVAVVVHWPARRRGELADVDVGGDKVEGRSGKDKSQGDVKRKT